MQSKYNKALTNTTNKLSKKVATKIDLYPAMSYFSARSHIATATANCVKNRRKMALYPDVMG